MSITSGRRRLALAVLSAVAALLSTAAMASAKTFEVTYDWNDARYGFQGWLLDNAPPTDAAGEPWYTSTQTRSRGLKIVPKGGTRAYRDARGTWAWNPPAGATIRRAHIEGLDGKAIQRQFARAWLVVDGEPPEARSNLKELGYDDTGMSSATWMNRDYTLITPSGKNGVGFVLWLFTIPCESMEEPSPCVPVGPSDDASVSLRKAVFTVDDPSKATMDVSGLPSGTTWTRDRQVRLRIASTDPQSGVAKIEATIRGGGDSRTLGLGRWSPDRFNTADRTPGEPPLQIARNVDRTVSVARTGTTRLTLRTTNGAGTTTTSQAQVRVDRDRPDIAWPRKPGPGDPVRVADRPSGVQSATLTVDGRDRDTCSDARSCRLKVPSDVADRSRVRVRVVDRAGNERSGTRTVRVAGVAKDHRSPKIAWPKSVKAGSSATVSDDSSGIADATLAKLDPTADADRCGGGQRRCKVKVPADAAGKEVRVIAFDRAGNRTSSTRRVLKRACRPRSTCPAPAKPVKSSFLTYPADNADLWSGPLRFRWTRPTVKGVRAGVPLWYRLTVDGQEVYSGPETAHEEYGTQLDEHQWRVAVYRSRSSTRTIASATRRFRMVQYGSTPGEPTDTDDTLAPAPLTRSARAASTKPMSPGSSAETDLGRRFAPWIKMHHSERWRPIAVSTYLSRERNSLFFCEPKDSCGDSGNKFLSLFKGRGHHCTDCRIDVAATKPEENFKIGISNDDSYKVSRRCQYGTDSYECAREQPLYWAVRYSSAEGGLYAISYWWFWRYNDGHAPGTGWDHEGDWEGVNIYVGASDKRIRHVVYDQHGVPVQYRRSFVKTHGDGDQIYVYPSEGRHASYPWKGTGQESVLGASAIPGSLRELHDGQRGWWGNQKRGCGDGTSCYHAFPVVSRGSLIQGPFPSGWWASYRGNWGAAGPVGPGISGVNRRRLVEPFDYLKDARLVQTSRSAHQSGEQCGTRLPSGLAASLCSVTDVAPDGRIEVSSTGTATQSGYFDSEDGTSVAAVQDSAVRDGSEIRAVGPIPAGTRLVFRAEGPGMSGYSGVGTLPDVPAGQVWSVGIHTASGDLTTSNPASVVVRPVADPTRQTSVAVATHGRIAELRVFGFQEAGLRVQTAPSATSQPGRLRKLARGRLLPSGYRLYRVKVPRGTHWIIGRDRGGRRVFEAEADVPVQRVAPDDRGGGAPAGEGAGRPTK